MQEKDIKYLAKLCKLNIADEEVSKMKHDFDELLGFVGKLQSIDTEGVDMMYTPIDSSSLDLARKTNLEVDSKELLQNSPNQISGDSIVIKSFTVEH